MCGITGFVNIGSKRELNRDTLMNQVVRMSDMLEHRGPDSSGFWVDEVHGIALGHRRLSIVDTSSGGAQPMCSHDGNIVICFNGEIYNHIELRNELEQSGVSFKSTSDTEVLVSGIVHWGLESTVKRLIGQFAFAMVDRANNSFHLVRDRVGEKPLYYGWLGKELVFASELKALTVLPSWVGSINTEALALYFRHNYIPSPHSIYQGIYKLPPASIISISLRVSNFDRALPITRYWSLFVREKRAVATDSEIEKRITQSVKRQMVADVPVGAFLSGGVDSSTIVALMTESATLPVQTFTIGFDDPKFNEAKHAASVAKHLDTDHHEFILSAQDAMNIIPELPQIYDEPFADSSQLPTFLISKMIRSKVTVALSGDGGDELFCGYERYFVTQEIWRSLSKVPHSLLSLLANIIHRLPMSALQVFSTIAKRLPGSGSKLNPTKIKRLAVLSGSSTFDQLYKGIISHELNPERMVLGGAEGASEFSLEPDYGARSRWGDMMARDINSYLPDDILTKVDRASMANSLEVRVPLLSHDVMESAWSRHPDSDASVPKPTKKILRNILYKRVPKSLIERPKVGFAVPMGDWLDGPLKTWVMDLLNPDVIKNQNILDPRIVSNLLSDHYQGRADHKDRLWNLVVFQSWFNDAKR
jgi:asparagine synthase (glutamine-hydrolysing)